MVLNFPTSPINGQVSNDFYFDSSVGTEGAWRSSPVPIGGLPAGSIIQWAGSTAPANWFIADGSAVSRTANASLFAVIGTTYGSGDGSTTFNLPDLRGRVAVGKNAATFGTLGATGGEESHLLTGPESGIQAHNHSPAAIIDATTLKWGINFTPGSGASTITSGGTAQAPFTGTTGPSNATSAHNNLQPYLVTNYIIKATAGWSAGDSELAQRVGVLEAAPAGLVRVVPTSVAVGSGSASVSASGVVTFTGASSVSLNGCFTSAFRNYRVIWTSGSSAAALMQLRFRASGTDNAANYYTGGMAGRVTASVATFSGNNIAQAYIGQLNGPAIGASYGSLDIIDPQTTNWARATGVGWGGDATSMMGLSLGMMHASGTQFDGVSFIPSTGVSEGTIQVYGYRN